MLKQREKKDYIKQFENERIENVNAMGNDKEYQELTRKWFLKSCDYKYDYSFSWLGRPYIQMPMDMVLIQEIIWDVKPDLIIETGIAHGGSLIFAASILELMHLYFPEHDGHALQCCYLRRLRTW